MFNSRALKIFTFPLLMFLAAFFQGHPERLPHKRSHQPEVVHVEKASPYDASIFDSLSLKAKSVYVFDIETGTPIYEKSAQRLRPLASLTKMMTAIIALDELGSNAVITISEDAVADVGDNGLLAGEEWRLEDLLKLTLVSSSNDAIHAIAETLAEKEGETNPRLALVKKLNAKAEELGMNSTRFFDPAGLDFTSDASAFGSAEDVYTLMRYGLRRYPELFQTTALAELTIRSLDGVPHTVENTNEVADVIPELVTSKTGFTDIAQGNLAFIFEAGPAQPVAVIILGSTFEERFSDAQQIIKGVLVALQNKGK